MTSGNHRPETQSRNRNEWQPAERVEDLACRLVRIPSETGTPDEEGFAQKLVDILMEIPYFAENPSDIRVVPGLGHTKAQNVVAVVRGQGRKSLLLAGHYDTVSIDNYHDLKDLSREPYELKEALVSDLSARSLNEQEDKALRDLESGEFLPGRGMLDMKSGLAAGIAVLERFANQEGRQGNLVLCCSPDEERDSRGMRALRDWLPQLMDDLQLDPVGAINMDVTSDQGDGSEGRAAYAGTIGKLMPFALVIGQSSHASYPYEGVSAQLIAAEVVRRIEANAELSDHTPEAISPPPICLEARDLRDVYEVTTPERTWLAFNWLYHSWTPEELFKRFRTEVKSAAEEAVARISENARSYAEKSGGTDWPGAAGVRILTYAEVKQEAARQMGNEFQSVLEAKQSELQSVDNPLSASRELTNWLVAQARVSGPVVIVGFASLHYPATRLDLEHAHDAALHSAITETLSGYEAEPSRRVKWRPYFEGISDMSFFGQPSKDTSSVVSDNTPPAWLVDRPNENALRCPMVNIGPWGREFHQRLERVYKPYAFDELPRIIAEIGDRFLGNHE
ncbi:M20/M25/M40 family metallo-hydrolase [Roseibium sp. SCP14]|uniref:M20/M25/M40 family metallo-hydrolase n=1 Tax=Roseibium sp. SCP14 TaxID=3141375 RepID=UPI00333CEFEC